MDWSEIYALAVAHKYLPLAIVMSGFLARIAQDDTKFPVNIPFQYRGVIALGLADVYNVLVVWPKWQLAINPAMVVAFFVLLMQAIYFNRTEPKWFTWLATVIFPQLTQKEKLEGGTPMKTAIVEAKASPVSASKSKPPPPLTMIACFLLAAVAIRFLVACGASPSTISKIDRAILTADQIECIMSKEITSVPELAAVCEVDQALVPAVTPVVNGLVSVRETSKKAGHPWKHVIIDAGAP